MATGVGLLLLLALLARASSFAISSSNAPKRKKISNQGKAPGGFAKKPNDSVPTSHTRDESASTKNLVKFLLQWKSEGLGPAEVGFDMCTGIRGMYATQPFKKNEIVCKIKSDLALALTDPSLATEETMNIPDGALNFLRWYQNNEQARSLWSDYLDTLPTKEAHFDVSCCLSKREYNKSSIYKIRHTCISLSPHPIFIQMRRSNSSSSR